MKFGPRTRSIQIPADPSVLDPSQAAKHAGGYRQGTFVPSCLPCVRSEDEKRLCRKALKSRVAAMGTSLVDASCLNPLSHIKRTSMKNTKKTVKRDIYKSGRTDGLDHKSHSSKRLSHSECSGTAVVHCNQWECFTRYLCRDTDPDSESESS